VETPRTLLERLRQPGNSAAWERFLGLYTPLLYRHARSLGLQEADAADLVQDVLTLLFRKLPEFRHAGPGSFRAWLRVVMRNKLAERRRQRVPATAEEAALAELESPDEQGALEETEYRRHLVQQGLVALRDEFPATTWKAFERYALDGCEVEQVAAELGVRVGTVYAAKSRVLSRLRQELDGLLD
jgi:RNA polymerase sigma-70 factor (ECF subfamily)